MRPRTGRCAPWIRSLFPVLVFMLSACTALPGSPNNPVWVLQSINGKPVLPDATVSLTFQTFTGTVRGDAGCNRYGGPYALSGDSLDVLEIEASAMECPDANVMQQEELYLDMLWDVTTYSLEDGVLILETDHSRRLVFAAQR